MDVNRNALHENVARFLLASAYVKKKSADHSDIPSDIAHLGGGGGLFRLIDFHSRNNERSSERKWENSVVDVLFIR